MTKQNQAYIYALLAVFFWSTVASAFKIALRYNSPLPLLCGASFFSLCSLLAVAAWQGKLKLFRNFSIKQLSLPIALGVINPFFYYLILFRAYELLPAQIAQPLNFTWSIMMVLLSIVIQKQKVRYYDILAVILCYSGVLVISSGGGKLGEINSLGVVLALGTSILWAFYWIYNVESKIDPLVKLITGFATGTLLILICCLVTGSIPSLSWQSITSMFYIGLFEMGLTFVFWLKALELTERTVKISNLIFLSPFASFIFIRISLGEHIAVTSVAGLALVVTGIIFQHSRARKEKR
ncbi:MAG: DMT family transporter [Candidatus Cloacimonetes bacterium]|nr:DMT family transporter [Candidatus Cloacimonadota bacterium]